MASAHQLELKTLLLQHPAHFLSLGFGSGLAAKAPGTFGSLAALPLLWVLWQTSVLIISVTIVIGFAVGIWCTGKTANAMAVKDPSAIVWDEFIGLFISGMPYFFGAALLGPDLFTQVQHSMGLQLLALAVTFVVFRFFDIFKPFPISWADQNFDGGLGIMIDDVFAGLAAALVLAGIAFTLA